MGRRIKKRVKHKPIRRSKAAGRSSRQRAASADNVSSRHSPKVGSRHKRPMGITALLHYTVILAMLSVIAIFTSPRTLLFGFDLGGMYAPLAAFMFFIMNAAVIYGIAYKERWTFSVAVVSYVLSIANSVLAIFHFGNLSAEMESMMDILLPASYISIFMNLLTLWFIYEKKEYFRVWYGTDDLVDHVFRLAVYLFLVVIAVMIIVLFAGVVFFVHSGSSRMLDTISTMEFTEAQAFCDAQADAERDQCYVLLTSAFSNEDDIHKICYGIKRPMYKYLCEEMTG